VQLQVDDVGHLTAAALRAHLKEVLLALHSRQPRLAWALLSCWGISHSSRSSSSTPDPAPPGCMTPSAQASAASPRQGSAAGSAAAVMSGAGDDDDDDSSSGAAEGPEEQGSLRFQKLLQKGLPGLQLVALQQAWQQLMSVLQGQQPPSLDAQHVSVRCCLQQLVLRR
jgi:hypothetical protein